MKRYQRFFPLLLALCLLCMSSVTSYAQETLDMGKKGSITVEMKYKKKAVTGGMLKAYRIGCIQEKNGDYSFVKTTAMEGFKPSYKNLDDIDLPGKAAAYVRRNDLKAYASKKNENGKVVFSNLELGLYLIVQTKASDGFEPLSPFLVSVPMNENGSYIYEVNAKGKFELDREPDTGGGSNSGETEPGGNAPRPGGGGGSSSGETERPGYAPRPGSSSKPSPLLPQTGQLNWPIPVLTVLGLMLFSTGWVLRFSEKRGAYEK